MCALERGSRDWDSEEYTFTCVLEGRTARVLSKSDNDETDTRALRDKFECREIEGQEAQIERPIGISKLSKDTREAVIVNIKFIYSCNAGVRR